MRRMNPEKPTLAQRKRASFLQELNGADSRLEKPQPDGTLVVLFFYGTEIDSMVRLERPAHGIPRVLRSATRQPMDQTFSTGRLAGEKGLNLVDTGLSEDEALTWMEEGEPMTDELTGYVTCRKVPDQLRGHP